MNEDATLPAWTFDAQEMSTCVYRIRGKHRLGRTIELVGTDPYFDELMEDGKTLATLIDRHQIWRITYPESR
jgi:hypothetical protein